ncbi:MAG: methionyl-tRNA formyltransferase [Oscillospiraceae bacterium]|nr:methionyl-tRNA formyltransferase [Oscillospiraceae bacterium]
MRIVFMGTPDFAVPSLEKLIEQGYELAGVFTQPDRPKNRGMKLTPSSVKVCAQKHGIPVYQPVSFKKEPEALETLKSLEPDLVVVAAFGQILPQAVLDVPKLGCINVHSSLLPKYRGAAPINWVILNGEQETGVTIMKMALALDAGDIIAQAKTPIDPDETVEQLHDRLAQIGANLLGEIIPALESHTAVFTPQNDAESTYAPMLSRTLSTMDWTRSARELHNQVRGLIPWPAASAELGGVNFKIYTVAETGQRTEATPGTVISAGNEGILVACGDGTALRILELQAPGKKRMSAADYLRGHPIF